MDGEEYCRALYTAAELKKIKTIKIEAAREMVKQNQVKGTSAASIDPEAMVWLDVRLKFPVFITKDNMYTREELLQSFSFNERVSPEKVFTQQEIGVFKTSRGDTEYVSRDIGDADGFAVAESLVRMATNKNKPTAPPIKPIQIVKTKIYLGRQSWKDFKLISRVARGVEKFLPQLAYNTFSMSGQPSNLLVDSKTLEDIRRREEIMAQKEKELNSLEAKLKDLEKYVREQMEKLDANNVV